MQWKYPTGGQQKALHAQKFERLECFVLKYNNCYI